MIDGVNDEVTDALDSIQNVMLMEGSRIVEAVMRRRADMAHQAAYAERTEANEARARLRVEAAQSRMSLQPVMSDNWWAGASMERIAEHYKDAKGWDGIDPSFQVYVDRIEAQAKALHDLDPHHILDHIRPRTEAAVVQEAGGPMTVDQARAAAVTTPVWYGVHDALTTDLPPLIRAREEKRLVEDMIAFRDTGRLDNESARMEWARYTDHAAATMTQDENESLPEFQERRGKALQEHWDHTVEDRAGLGRHNESMEGVARPMSVSEAREFMNEFAPEWFRTGHDQLENAQLFEHAGENIANSRSMNDQMRYAMEHLRDTGTLEHSYARSMRDTLALNPDLDLSVGPKTITPADRVRFGGSEHSRPLTYAEATRLINFAPEWYQKPVMAALGEGTMLSPAQRAGQADALVSDMTRLRDHGVLDTDHAMRVWAAQQPSAVDPKWGEALPVKSIWADTVDARARPQVVPEDVRAETGAGVPGVRQPGLRGEVGRGQGDARHTQGGERPAESRQGDEVKSKGPAWDTAEARTGRARELREAGFSPEEVRAQMLADWNCSTPPGTPNPSRETTPAQGHKNPGQGRGREKGNTLHR